MENNEEFIFFENYTIEVVRDYDGPIKNGVILMGKEEDIIICGKKEVIMPHLEYIEFENPYLLNLFQSGLQLMKVAIDMKNE